MSTLTVDMLKDVAKLLEPAPKIPTKFTVGSKLMFEAAVKKAGVQFFREQGVPVGNLAGIPVEICTLVPEHLMVVMSDDEILQIVDLGGEES